VRHTGGFGDGVLVRQVPAVIAYHGLFVGIILRLPAELLFRFFYRDEGVFRSSLIHPRVQRGGFQFIQNAQHNHHRFGGEANDLFAETGFTQHRLVIFSYAGEFFRVDIECMRYFGQTYVDDPRITAGYAKVRKELTILIQQALDKYCDRLEGKHPRSAR